MSYIYSSIHGNNDLTFVFKPRVFPATAACKHIAPYFHRAVIINAKHDARRMIINGKSSHYLTHWHQRKWRHFHSDFLSTLSLKSGSEATTQVAIHLVWIASWSKIGRHSSYYRNNTTRVCIYPPVGFFGRIEQWAYRISMTFVGRRTGNRIANWRRPWRKDRRSDDGGPSIHPPFLRPLLLSQLLSNCRPPILCVPRHPEGDITSLTDPQVTTARLMRDLTAYSRIRHFHETCTPVNVTFPLFSSGRLFSE